MLLLRALISALGEVKPLEIAGSGALPLILTPLTRPSRRWWTWCGRPQVGRPSR